MRSLWRAALTRLTGRARRWALRRQGPDPAQLTLDSRRIYILPTSAGLLYAVMLTTMLAGAMNYNNNLGFATTFLLAGLGVVTIYHCHRTLAGLRIHCLGAAPVFAGDAAQVRFSLINDSLETRDEIQLGWDGDEPGATALAPCERRLVKLTLPTTRRGPLAFPGLRVATTAPLGLLRSWSWIQLGPRVLVYPRPAAPAAAPYHEEAGPAPGASRPRGDDDFAGLRSFQPGDSPRRIAWKAYARTGEMLVREYRGGTAETRVWIDWDAVPAPDTETRISRLTRLVLDHHQQGRVWGLRLPGLRLGPAQGVAHLHRCLSCLATFRLPAA